MKEQLSEKPTTTESLEPRENSTARGNFTPQCEEIDEAPHTHTHDQLFPAALVFAARDFLPSRIYIYLNLMLASRFFLSVIYYARARLS